MELSKGDVDVLQRKLYFLLERLQEMAKELPLAVQQRISCELLSGLANCVLNDTIYQIIKGLMEIQHMTEKQLEQTRIGLMKSHRLAMALALKNINCLKQRKRRKRELQKQHEQELAELDKKIIVHLDEKVTDQQQTLEQAGVPGFYVTDNPIQISIQMHLVDFIFRLSRLLEAMP